MPLEYVLYTSIARLPSDFAARNEGLARILAGARSHNARNDVSGYLALVGDVFVQIVEGEPLVLNGIMLRISHDFRHSDMQVLARGKRTQRRFAGWSMGCTLDEATMRVARRRAETGDTPLRQASARQLEALLEALASEAALRGSELVA